MPFAEYGSTDRSDRDKTYARKAALIDGFEFDWRRHHIPKAAYEATDTTHWLALQTAIDAVAASGLDLDAIGRDNIGVVVGNSLTGEVSRANLLRLRWPYVRCAIIEGLDESPLSTDEQVALLAAIEASFKAPFPLPNEDTLAGALSNVIAGRICNFMDLHGGGYTVDGACASSLLAVATACDTLSNKRADLMLAGGVDISLDPLELVGFARAGALTENEMRVYDRNSSGFIAGEGCGFVVLMREEDATGHGIEPWALINGWGISSDGCGGITAPKTETQLLAIRTPAESFTTEGARLYPIGTGTPLEDRETPMRAGVSSAGFGGINCHVALSSPQTPPKPITTLPTRVLLTSAQAAELFVASGDSPADVMARLCELATRARGMGQMPPSRRGKRRARYARTGHGPAGMTRQGLADELATRARGMGWKCWRA